MANDISARTNRRQGGYSICNLCSKPIKWVQDNFTKKWQATTPGSNRTHTCRARSNSPFYQDRVKLNDF